MSVAHREQHYNRMVRMVYPVLLMTAHEETPNDWTDGGSTPYNVYSKLEAFCRCLAGIAPWLELEQSQLPKNELQMRNIFHSLILDSFANLFDLASPLYQSPTLSRQYLVEMGWLSLAILRAPTTLGTLEDKMRKRIVYALEASRQWKPLENNWLLFSAAVECALYALEPDRPQRLVGPDVPTLVERVFAMYKGDGAYGDGDYFAFDYYNSFVIHPFLTAIFESSASDHIWNSLPVPSALRWFSLRDAHKPRAIRYANVLMRMIHPSGSFPPLGRSLSYRTGVMHAVADAALRDYTAEVPSFVMRDTISAVCDACLPNAYENEFLTVGLRGHQPALAEFYISRGSLYAAALVFVTLGIDPNASFWTAPTLGVSMYFQAWTRSYQLYPDRSIDPYSGPDNTVLSEEEHDA